MSSPPSPVRIPPPVAIPAPPVDPAGLSPLLTTWQEGRRLFRCYNLAREATEFHARDATRRGRFHPLTPLDGDPAVPVLYAADDQLGALSETVFHDVPVRGDKRVPMAKLRGRAIAEIVVARDLRLIDLSSDGLRRLGLSRGELIDSDARSYGDTANWAAVLHAHPAGADGLLWVSRQRDTSRALILFGDRVKPDDVRLCEESTPLPLSFGAGLDLVCAAADRVGITIIGIPD